MGEVSLEREKAGLQGRDVSRYIQSLPRSSDNLQARQVDRLTLNVKVVLSHHLQELISNENQGLEKLRTVREDLEGLGCIVSLQFLRNISRDKERIINNLLEFLKNVDLSAYASLSLQEQTRRMNRFD